METSEYREMHSTCFFDVYYGPLIIWSSSDIFKGGHKRVARLKVKLFFSCRLTLDSFITRPIFFFYIYQRYKLQVDFELHHINALISIPFNFNTL